MTQTNRKRGRSIEDESSEFTPLSKRINNLHINNLNKLCDTASEQPLLEPEWSNRNCVVPSPNLSEPSQSSSSSSSDGFGNSVPPNIGSAEYQPDLSPIENPHYYENNKLLYALYLERMHRRGNFN